MEITLYNEFPQELKSDWNKLVAEGVSRVPFLRFEYLQTWWINRGGGEWPQEAQLVILVGKEADQVIGIAPFFIAQHEGKEKLILLGSVDISDFLDLIVAPENLNPFVDCLIHYLKTELLPSKGIHTVDFFNLLDDSPTLQVIKNEASAAGFSVIEEVLQPSPYIHLPGDWEQYLGSMDKKQRHEIRRKMRRAAESEIPVEVYITSDPQKLDEDIDSFFSLMTQDPEKQEFLTDAMRNQFRQIIRIAFDSGGLQFAFLVIDGVKAAAYLNLDYLNRVWVYNSGLDRRYMEYSPGWVLLGHLLQWANESGRTEFDFMRGNEDYKYKFGANDRFVMRVTLEHK